MSKNGTIFLKKNGTIVLKYEDATVQRSLTTADRPASVEVFSGTSVDTSVEEAASIPRYGAERQSQ